MKKINFERLTPDDSINISSYEEALDFSLSNKMTNIALSGPYGAGKSSVIEAYKKKKPEKKYMHISLSHFDGSKSIDTQILEGKIINQLLHQIEYTKIPKTIFKVKENLSKSKIWGITSAVAVAIFSSILTFKYSDWENFVEQFFITNPPGWLISNQLHTVSFFLFMLFTFFFIYKFMKLQMNQQLLKKIIVKGNEIEIFKDSNESYFDKFMNDVIYLFINSGMDIIIFEDLDRFDDPTIYERLHEINSLVNRRIGIKENNRQLVFIYLIKDDTFKSKDRTKFFDMIIPIVPVIDSSNSFDKFLSIFEKSEIKDDFDVQNLRKMSLYIDDMRLLKNINNEYLIYKNRLDSITLNNNKLLAIITYKNLFPEDFSSFQSGVGYINEIIKNKKLINQKRTEEILIELSEVKADIQLAEQEMIDDINELDAIYFQISPEMYITVNEKKENDFVSRSEFIKAIKDNGYIVNQYTATNSRYNGGLHWAPAQIDLSQRFNDLKRNEQYNRKLNTIENKSKIQQFQQRKSELEKARIRLLSAPLSEILNSEDNNFFVDKTIFPEIYHYLFLSQYFPFIIFLLREGLIDENYGDYLTYFYASSLKKEDKEFLRGIYDRTPKDVEYKLNNLELILSNLSITDITTYTIKNIDLMTYLITQFPKYESHLFRAIDVMKGSENNYYLLQTYEEFLKKTHVKRFSEVIVKIWPSVLKDTILKHSADLKELEFIYMIASFCEIQTIKDNNEEQILAEYIGQQQIKYLGKLSKIQQITLLEKFKRIGVKYNNLTSEDIRDEDIREVVKLRMFVLSEQNLKKILGIFNVSYAEDEFFSSNITLFSNANPGNIYDYLVNDEINAYIRLYLSFSYSKLSEESDVIGKILNSNKLDEKLSNELLERVVFTEQMEDVNDVVKKEYWEILLKNKNLKVNEKNIISFYRNNNNNFSKEMISAINEETEEILFSNDLFSTEEERNLLWESIVTNDNFITDQYISMLKSLNFVYKRGFSLDISDEKINRLIYSNIIKLTKENLIEVMRNHSNNIVDFAFLNIDKFCEILSGEDVYDTQVILNLLSEEKLSSAQKKKIIDISKHELSIQNVKCTADIIKYILESKYSNSDLAYIAKNYSKFNKIVRVEIKKLIIDNISSIINNKLDIDVILLDELLSDDSFMEKEELFSWYIQKYENKEVMLYIKKLNFPQEFMMVLDKKRPKFQNTDLNKRILADYKRRGWITRIDPEDGMLRVNGRKILPL